MRFTYAEAMTDATYYQPLARAAEAAGYSSMTVADSLVYPRESDSTYPYTEDDDELVGDPLAVVRRIYRSWGLPWDDTVEEAVRREHAASRSGPRRPRHSYDLADYGLTADGVRSRF